MNKSELLSIYTAEQLANMVINLQSASEVKNDEIHRFWRNIAPHTATLECL